MIRRSFVVTGLLALLAACRGNGGQFEGTWHCDTSNPLLGKVFIKIRHYSSNFYIVEWPMIGNISFSYKDGKLIGPNQAILTIDDSGELVGMPACAMKNTG